VRRQQRTEKGYRGRMRTRSGWAQLTAKKPMAEKLTRERRKGGGSTGRGSENKAKKKSGGGAGVRGRSRKQALEKRGRSKRALKTETDIARLAGRRRGGEKERCRLDGADWHTARRDGGRERTRRKNWSPTSRLMAGRSNHTVGTTNRGGGQQRRQRKPESKGRGKKTAEP